MVIYTREEKTLIIPEGLGSSMSCEEQYREGYDNGYQSGYTEGYAEGQADCSGGTGCNLQAKSQSIDGSGTGLWNIYPDAGYDGMERVTILDDGYGQAKYQEGYAAGQADCPECSGGTCNLEMKNYEIDASGEGVWIVEPDNGYDGISHLTIYDAGYGGKWYDTGLQEGYQSGYTAGLNDCSGSTPCDCSSAVTEAYESGYTEGYQSGYTQGQAECPECDCTEECTICYNQGYADGRESVTSGCPMQSKSIRMNNIETTVTPDYGYVGLDSVYINAEDVYNDAYSTGYTEGYQSGYTAGQQDCSGSSCNLTDAWIDLMDGDDFEGQGVDYYVSAITPNYDGWYKVHIQDKDYGSSKYQEGYADGQAACPECDCSSAVTEAYQSGYTEGYQSGSTDGYTDGFNDGYLSGASDTCGNAINEAYELGYQSGTTDGFNDGHSSGYTDGYDAGEQDGYAQGYAAGQADCPSCEGVIYNVELDSGWTGSSDILPGELINEIMITDTGYSEAKYNEGYSQGYSDGASDCSTAIEQAYESGYTAGEGEIHTIEVVIKTENNYYAPLTGAPRAVVVLTEGEGVDAHTTPYDQSNIIEGDGVSEYVGTYDFNTQDSEDPSLYYFSQIYDTTAKTLTLCFKGYLYNNSGVYPQPIYGCPSSLGVEVMASNINNWGNWSVETVRFNGRPLYDNNGGLSKIGNGGFKLKPTYYGDSPAVTSGCRQIGMSIFN